MKMKYIFGVALTSVMFASCSEDIMDHINKDEAHPSININAKLQLTDAEVATVYSTLCGNYAWYVSSYTEQLFGTGNNQLRMVEKRNLSEVAGSAVFENEWNSTYLNLNNLRLMHNKCQEGGVNASANDIIYSGKVAKWAAFAHALKARYLLRTYGVNKTTAQLQKVVAEAQAAISGGFEGCELAVFNGQTADNSWYAYAQSRSYTGCSSTVEKLLTARNDPREPIYNYNKFGKNVVANPGDDALASETEYVNWPAYLDNGAAPLHMMSSSELYFILAEAQARLGTDAKTAFEKGVTASIKDFYTAGGSVIEASITDAQIANYLTSINARFTANPLNEILIQKYIAQTRDEQLETYNDIRRCRYIDGSYPVAMTNPNNTSGGANRWPLCLPYGDSDVKSNPHVTAAFGSGNDAGMYVFTKRVWWAGGE